MASRLATRIPTRLAASLAALVLAAVPLAAQRTDRLVLRNGDQVTGEIKDLARGQLKYKTDDMGTLTIEWDKVVRLESVNYYQLEVTSGLRYFGRLEPAPEEGVLYVVLTDTNALRIPDVVLIERIRAEGWERLSGYLDLGFSYQQANHTVQLTTGAEVSYRSPRVEAVIGGNTYLLNQEAADPTDRRSLNTTGRLLLPRRWSAGLALAFEHNRELELDLRSTLQAFGARALIVSGGLEWRAGAGIVLSRETFLGVDSATVTIEGALGTDFSLFRYDTPKTDVSLAAAAYPSFTTAGRVRLEGDLRASHELFADFSVTLTVFERYDSKPPSAGAVKNDFGTTFGVSWSFRR